jgi:pentatricopeptide repeat protein
MIKNCREILNEMLLYDANHNHCLSSKQQQGSDIPMVKHYNRVLLTLARAGRADEAEQLVREMQSADAKPNKVVIQPNLITYNFLLLGWSKSKSLRAPFAAEAVLQEMMMQQKQQQQQRQATRITIQPDHVSLNTALTCWDRSNHPQAPERAWRLYTTIKNKCQVKPDTFTFSILLQAVARSRAHTPDQKATMAIQVQQEMAKEGIRADGYVQMLIEKCSKRTKAKPPSGSRPSMDEVGVL